ncbi:dihydrolipoyllysine-residue acetyltransferase [Aliikangiella coralliicola]|uniref:Acetyltransferase component of pyruvate dehydrogenase complex n=1 Tax=Aliikangiella coralliicola TaxID=2592383 RepID=A0A545TZZ4_9GAMM|nr:dihydrolipoyllysine-residue acetyltransferase [Aliikangiella coralliicola]TQV82787.1 dihydrolipoyllysine-residue acetyltransferase [Aliikangiella coralliicola]
MSDLVQVNVPDIGDVSEVDVIELLVNVGDTIAKDDSLITLETDKATMDVPSSESGVVKAIHVQVGDQVSQGDLILEVEASASGVTEAKTSAAEPDVAAEQEAVSEQVAESVPEQPVENVQPAASQAEEKDLTVPDIGDASDVDVIEVLIADGDSIKKDQGLIVLETDKATMEVPASDDGTILSVSVKVGDKVSQGDVIGRIKTESADAPKASQPPAAVTAPAPVAKESKSAPVPDHPQMKKKASKGIVHASPAVRRFARELGADLAKVKGSGPKGRILKEDVQNFIKFELSRPKATAATGAFSTPQMPEVDHAKWGEIESKPLTRIQKISSVNLHRNWITIPHVTQHEDADITDLDAFRKSLKDEAARDGVRLTPLAFIMKGLVHTLKAFPKFNASLASDGENLIFKNYYHIGVAVETPDGLTVPVIRDVDQKGIYQLATELGEISAKAREKKLSADDMQGSSFTISSLGGIGGTAFSPIVKWPDVAILGLSRNKMQPVWNGSEFVPRLMLPMSLSYDHRVIDGADAARFVVHLSQTLNDIRRVLLK